VPTNDLARARPTLRLVLGSRLGTGGAAAPLPATVKRTNEQKKSLYSIIYVQIYETGCELIVLIFTQFSRQRRALSASHDIFRHVDTSVRYCHHRHAHPIASFPDFFDYYFVRRFRHVHSIYLFHKYKSRHKSRKLLFHLGAVHILRDHIITSFWPIYSNVISSETVNPYDTGGRVWRFFFKFLQL
jgi:hypothetical protein